MVLALMQPYFFPYIGYFDLINCSDEFVVFDTAQYIKQGWINRNRVLHPVDDWQYILAPVEKHESHTPISRVTIVPGDDWKLKLLAKLRHLKSHAPFFSETMELIEDCLSTEERHISTLNVTILSKICQHLNISFNYRFLSKSQLEFQEDLGPGDWALKMAESLRAQKYVNLPSGEALFDRDAFDRSNIELCVRKIPEFIYSTGKFNHQSKLSIIDVLMWNQVDTVHDFLQSQKDQEGLVDRHHD